MHNYNVVKVLDRKTGKERYIKERSFNPDLFDKIEGERAMSRATYRSLILGQEKDKFIAPRIEIPAEKVVKTEKKEDNINDDEMPKLMFAARKWAKERGMKVSPKTTKADIKTWATTNLP